MLMKKYLKSLNISLIKLIATIKLVSTKIIRECIRFLVSERLYY